MKAYLRSLDPKLRLIRFEEKDNVIHIYCETPPMKNRKVHSYHERRIQDLPSGDQAVVLHVIVRRYFVGHGRKRFISDPLDFVEGTKTRTKRLTNHIIDQSKETTALGAERALKAGKITVSDTTIIRIKKNK